MICQYCGTKLFEGFCTNPACPGRLRGTPPSKDPKMRELENAYIEQGAILEWIQRILDGIEVSDFALSYPIVRQVWDLKQEAMEYMIITEWDGTKVDQAMSVFRKALEELEAEVRSLKAKADETTGKIMKVSPIKYDYNPDITAYTRTGTLYNPSLETIVANARAEAEKKWNAVVSIHEDNKVALENNTALRKKIDLIMENIGIPRTYTTHSYKSTRSRTRTEEKHTAGFIEDQMRNIPVDDGFSAAEAAHQRFMQAIDEYEKKALAEKEKQEKEQQARIRAEELAKALSVLVVKYELPYNSDWDSVLDKLLSMNKYLRLAHYLQKNRGDWSDGPDYAKTGLDGFTIETPQDEEIYNEISGLIVDWDGDGRVFRDATWNYGVLFGMVPAELLGDYQICMGYFGDY